MGTSDDSANNEYQCWQCVYYVRPTDKPFSSLTGEKCPCTRLGSPRSARAKICLYGRRDSVRWEAYLAAVASGEADEAPEVSEPDSAKKAELRPKKRHVPTGPALESYSWEIQRCVAHTNPVSPYTIAVTRTGLSLEELDALVYDGVLRRYKRNTSGYIYRLAGKYHYLVPKGGQD